MKASDHIANICNSLSSHTTFSVYPYEHPDDEVKLKNEYIVYDRTVAKCRMREVYKVRDDGIIKFVHNGKWEGLFKADAQEASFIEGDDIYYGVFDVRQFIQWCHLSSSSSKLGLRLKYTGPGQFVESEDFTYQAHLAFHKKLQEEQKITASSSSSSSSHTLETPAREKKNIELSDQMALYILDELSLKIKREDENDTHKLGWKWKKIFLNAGDIYRSGCGCDHCLVRWTTFFGSEENLFVRPEGQFQIRVDNFLSALSRYPERIKDGIQKRIGADETAIAFVDTLIERKNRMTLLDKLPSTFFTFDLNNKPELTDAIALEIFNGLFSEEQVDPTHKTWRTGTFPKNGENIPIYTVTNTSVSFLTKLTEFFGEDSEFMRDGNRHFFIEANLFEKMLFRNPQKIKEKIKHSASKQTLDYIDFLIYSNMCVTGRPSTKWRLPFIEHPPIPSGSIPFYPANTWNKEQAIAALSMVKGNAFTLRKTETDSTDFSFIITYKNHNRREYFERCYLLKGDAFVLSADHKNTGIKEWDDLPLCLPIHDFDKIIRNLKSHAVMVNPFRVLSFMPSDKTIASSHVAKKKKVLPRIALQTLAVADKKSDILTKRAIYKESPLTLDPKKPLHFGNHDTPVTLFASHPIHKSNHCMQIFHYIKSDLIEEPPASLRPVR